MKKKRRVLCMVLAVMLCLGMNPMGAMAAETVGADVMEMIRSDGLSLDIADENVFGGLYDLEANGNAREVMLTNCAIRMAYVDSTYLHMEFVTGSNAEATQIGVKDIEVQEKNGIFWNTIATSAGGSATDTYAFSGSCNSYTVELGKTYRVCCTHYAYINGSYLFLDNVTDGHKFS
ncbi:MAG: hypothetical protein UFG06_09340 [Lachnospiraceae bacterium]|nr:hypothetical protein [Lachnospiraceae bacterium]